MRDESPLSVNSFLTNGPTAFNASIVRHSHSRKRRFSQQAASQELPLVSHYSDEEEEEMLTNGQKRKLLSDLLIPDQHIKIEESEYSIRNSNNGVSDRFAIDSELVQDLSMSKLRFSKFDSNEQSRDKLSDDEMDSQSMTSNQDVVKSDNSDSFATDDEDKPKHKSNLEMINGFKLDIKQESELENKSNTSLDLTSEMLASNNEESALVKDEEEADKTMNDKLDHDEQHRVSPDADKLNADQ